MQFELFPIAEASVGTLMQSINRVILNPLIVFLFACAMLFFLYGVMQFIINPANEEMKKKGKSHMIWGVVGMAIMVSVFGIMQIILNTLGGSKTGIQIDRTGNYKIEINK
ncbi:MAG: hypothetical protein QG566_550 [Patescibacteria group bacterium]|nr:hypothetical protein [Patescibacteria group bacterium]